MAEAALQLVFPIRVKLERCIAKAIVQAVGQGDNFPLALFEGRVFGRSKKQGVSLRLPLSSCQPSQACMAACYAHDALDAAPNSVFRGVVNGVIASFYETARYPRTEIMTHLRRHINTAIRDALLEARIVEPEWKRDGRIRFSHVGEIAAFPAFANALAQEISTQSDGAVSSVIYTRHPNAKQLDPKLWVINFTLDKSSQNRRSWAPPTARLVFSAFGGEISKDVDVNFLEHHRWSHLTGSGKGTICPTTLPETQVRTCDAVKCKLCFETPAMTNRYTVIV